jgi:hypothetical protein
MKKHGGRILKYINGKTYEIIPDMNDAMRIAQLFVDKKLGYYESAKIAHKKLNLGQATFEQCFKYLMELAIFKRRKNRKYLLKEHINEALKQTLHNK